MDAKPLNENLERDKRGNPQTPLHKYLDHETYDICLKHLANNKTTFPDKIPNAILRNMPESFHKLLFIFITHYYKQKQIPSSWKISLTILLYKKKPRHNYQTTDELH